MSHVLLNTANTKRRVELRTGTPYANLNAAQLLFSETLAKHWGIASDNIIPFNGATGAIEAVRNHVLKTSTRKPPTVLTVSPGYWRARESFEGLGFEIIDLRTERNAFSINERALVERAKETRPDLLYLSLPNNPTGAIFEPQAIIGRVSEEMAIMIDVTLPCRDFDVATLTSALYEAFKQRSNLFLVGSTSKSHETAEYRIGWAICTSAKDANELRAENRSGISTIAINEGIERIRKPSMVLERIDRSFSFLEEGARRGKFQIVKPERRVKSSYVLLELLEPVERVRAILEENGIQVMWGSDFGLTDRHIRLETIEYSNIQIFIEAINGASAAGRTPASSLSIPQV